MQEIYFKRFLIIPKDYLYGAAIALDFMPFKWVLATNN